MRGERRPRRRFGPALTARGGRPGDGGQPTCRSSTRAIATTTGAAQPADRAELQPDFRRRRLPRRSAVAALGARLSQAAIRPHRRRRGRPQHRLGGDRRRASRVYLPAPWPRWHRARIPSPRSKMSAPCAATALEAGFAAGVRQADARGRSTFLAPGPACGWLPGRAPTWCSWPEAGAGAAAARARIGTRRRHHRLRCSAAGTTWRTSRIPLVVAAVLATQQALAQKLPSGVTRVGLEDGIRRSLAAGRGAARGCRPDEIRRRSRKRSSDGGSIRRQRPPG